MKHFITTAALMICLHGFAQQKIYVTAGSNLYTVNLSTCTSQLIGTLGPMGMGDIAVTPDGRLWGVNGNYLIQIDTLTGVATIVDTLSCSGNSLVELNDSTLLTAEPNIMSQLYAINVNTGVSSLIGSSGFSSMGDLTWYDNDLYLMGLSSSPGAFHLVKIQLDSTNSSIISAVGLNSISNPIPPFYGAITSPFDAEINAIIGFAWTNAYKFCPFDGSYQLLCPGIVPGTNYITGAATHRLLNQVPPPVTCNFITSANESHAKDFEIHPNPVTNELRIQNVELKIKKVEIYSMLGKKIFSQQETDNMKQIRVNVSELTPGIYFLKLGNVVHKFVKE